MVGGQWHAAGASLYGNYWVDRPPVLIGIFQIASSLGGLIALRVIGCLAVAAIVAGCAKSAGLIAGPRASAWAAVTAAALCTTPLLGTVAVNGELLASPFVVAGITATIAALKADDRRRIRMLAVAAGASGLCALLIKQNFADVFVFAVVAGLVAWRRRDIIGSHCARLFGAIAAGAVLAAYGVVLVTSLHGTSLRGVFNAMYPFRIEAGRVMAAAGRQHAAGRLDSLLIACVTSGVVLLLISIAWGVAARRLRGAATVALVAALAFDVTAIGFGGNYWTHYLVGVIVPLAILTGVLIARAQPLGRLLVALVAASSLLSWTAWISVEQPPTGSKVGSAIAASATHGDTIVTAYGHADVDQTSGLSSPYEYLWSLPAKTRDPQLQTLGRVLDGPNAPTWFVTWNRITSWGLDTHNVAATLAQDYRPFGQICGRTVYLRNGLNRPHLRSPATCHSESVAATITKDELP